MIILSLSSTDLFVILFFFNLKQPFCHFFPFTRILVLGAPTRLYIVLKLNYLGVPNSAQ